MSQAKIDKRKYEKYHRKEIQKKQKMKSILVTTAVVVVIAAAIGLPTGYGIYKNMPSTVASDHLEDYVSYHLSQQDNYPLLAPADESADGIETEIIE